MQSETLLVPRSNPTPMASSSEKGCAQRANTMLVTWAAKHPQQLSMVGGAPSANQKPASTMEHSSYQ